MPALPIDEEDLQARAVAVLAEAFPKSELGPITKLQGGASSITYWATFAASGSAVEEKVVLKVAPAGLAPEKNRDVLRQARVQRSLEGKGVPCPRVLAHHVGAPPEVPPFYVMSFENGDCVEPNSLPIVERLPAEEVRDRELEAARILGVLHSLDPSELGVGDEPQVTPDKELQRWVLSFAACDEDLRAGNEDVRDALAAGVPIGDRTTLIHGDFRLGNTLSMGRQVVSVIDWEIWAWSDPRVDLAWFLMMANPDPELGRHTAAGMPGNAELIDVYELGRGATTGELNWFHALVRYKQAAISALIIRNARRRGEAAPFAASNALLVSARKLLSGA